MRVLSSLVLTLLVAVAIGASACGSDDIDYAYWKHQTLAATFEVSSARTPSASSLAGIVNTTWMGTLTWLDAVRAHDAGSFSRAAAATMVAESPVHPFTAPFDGHDRLE